MIPTNIIIFLIVGVIIGFLFITFRPRKSYNLVPRKIWTYWDNPDKLPKAVKLCMDSWKKTNPEYEIILLTKKNFQGYVTIPDDIRTHPHFNESPERFSELVRLYALEEHGGIWIDASILVKKPFDDWLFPKYAEYSGFYRGSYTLDSKFPVIDCCFMAANKKSEFIKKWKEEYLEIGTFREIKNYLDSRKDMGINFNMLSDPHYSAIYVSAMKIIQHDKYNQDSLVLNDLDESALKYLRISKGDSEKGLELACIDQKYQTPILKMGPNERDIIEKELDYSLNNNKCNWIMT